MRCISDELIQKFIDNETSEKEEAVIHSHLATCGSCAKKVEERKLAAKRIKDRIGSLNKHEIQIPIFQESEKQKKTLYIKFKKLVYVASAACILGLFLIFHKEPNNEIDFMYSYDVECEYNANLPLSEQEMVIEIIDSKGKLIKY